MTFCPDCGEKIPRGAKYCDRCGKSLAGGGSGGALGGKPSVWKVVLGLFVLLVLFGFLAVSTETPSEGATVKPSAGATAQSTVPVAKCSDGTLAGKCSSEKPAYCGKQNELVAACSTCGCPSGLDCSSSGECKHTPTIDDWCDKIEPAAVRDAAASIARESPGAYNIGQLLLLYDWMKQNIAYVNDPSTGEYVASASETLAIGAGDCEDQAILVASLIKAIGGTSRIARSSECQHAFAQVYVGSEQDFNGLRDDILEHYRYAEAVFHFSQDDNGDYWMTVDPAGGNFLGDLHPDCSGVQFEVSKAC